MPFDPRAAKQLAEGAHIILEEYPGLRFVAGKRSRSWIFRYKDAEGAMRQVKIGEWPAVSLITAAAEWERLRALRARGIDPASEKKEKAQVRKAKRAPKPSVYTVQHLWDDYVEGHISKARKAKGQAETIRLFKKHGGAIAPLAAEGLTRKQAFSVIDAMAETPVSASQFKGELAAAWDYAIDAGRIQEDTPNWWRQIMRGRLKSKGKKIAGKNIGAGKRALSNAEAGELIRWLPNFSKMVADALTLYLWTGARGVEIMAMERTEVTAEADGLWWTVPKAKTKNERHEAATDFRVPLVGRAEAVVRRRMEQTDRWLFKSPRIDGPSQQKAIQTAVHYHQPYSETHPDQERPRLTVTHWAPHDLRRTVRTMLAALKCPDTVGEVILGHMIPGVAGVYNRHAYDAERREWLTKLSAHLEQCASTMPKPAG
ncbi:MAG: integrase family protein [Acidovorax sp.]|nr:integrase family protein [Acidovorax sp.]